MSGAKTGAHGSGFRHFLHRAAWYVKAAAAIHVVRSYVAEFTVVCDRKTIGLTVLEENFIMGSQGPQHAWQTHSSSYVHGTLLCTPFHSPLASA